jgi:hypothetical protein
MSDAYHSQLTSMSKSSSIRNRRCGLAQLLANPEIKNMEAHLATDSGQLMIMTKIEPIVECVQV